MLDALRRKFSRATTYLSSADSLAHTPERGCDVVISTLALCHVARLEGAIAEWGRVLRPGGEVVVTDYHPAASAAGNCTFRHEGRLIAVKIYVHSMYALESAAARNGLQLVAFDVATADESIKPAYASSGMLPVFERIRGQPLIYGARMCKISRP
jgi:ubiquinone/menaquinone biosynthesis C-methylase UbiE